MKDLESKRLDHLGLLAGICKELNIASTIDRLIPNDSPDKIVSVGTGVVAMILNGLGFVNKRLYLVEKFFEGKPLAKLLDVSYLESKHLNDDTLGRCQDALDNYGVNRLYSVLSQQSMSYLITNCELEPSGLNMDNSTFSLFSEEQAIVEEGRILFEVTRGYSKDHRPDLVQVGLQLIVETKSSLPLLMNALSGNADEGKSYGEAIKNHISGLQNSYGHLPLVGDSKFYNKENLAYLKAQEGLVWVSIVPNTIKKTMTRNNTAFKDLPGHPGYSYATEKSNYGDVAQQWVTFFSESLYDTHYKQLTRRKDKKVEEELKKYKEVAKRKFTCIEDARQALQLLEKGFTYTTLDNIEIMETHRYGKRGKPAKTDKPQKTFYSIKASTGFNEEIYEQKKQHLGHFTLASNDFGMSPGNLLITYKSQSVVEKSFRFLKDPKVVASSLFVQKPERKRAMLFIMTLCLLVYATLEYKIRYELKKRKQTFDNQVGKPIERPTLNWVFQCFEGIDLLYQEQEMIMILNLKSRHQKILDLLGKEYWAFYS